MSRNRIEMGGVLKADGTVVLDAMPHMATGRVRVVLEWVPFAPEHDPFLKGLRAIHAAQEARGHVPRTREQIDAELKELSDQDEEHALRIERLHEEAIAARARAERPS